MGRCASATRSDLRASQFATSASLAARFEPLKTGNGVATASPSKALPRSSPFQMRKTSLELDVKSMHSAVQSSQFARTWHFSPLERGHAVLGVALVEQEVSGCRSVGLCTTQDAKSEKHASASTRSGVVTGSVQSRNAPFLEMRASSRLSGSFSVFAGFK
eukprot:Polyplicarium_translucidae@DN4625_c0_g1_i1.p2